MPSIELTAPRVIAIEDRGRKYLLTVGRIQKKQWLRYFDGILDASENHAGQRVNSFDSTSALIDLIDSALIDAKGYVTEGEQPATATQGWQQLLPARHRLTAGAVLTDVQRADPQEDEPIRLGAETIYLDATWGANEGGAMQRYLNRVHKFKTPTSEQQRRYSRDASRSRVMGGRNGKTVWLGARTTLVDLYDELILGVAGYTVNGEDLGDDAPMIAREMDTYHKLAAADALFSPAMPSFDEGK